jgi:beta-1,3-galactosyltransferase 1/2/3/4/5/7/8
MIVARIHAERFLVAEEFKASESIGRRNYLIVIGINTALSSRKGIDNIRYT